MKITYYEAKGETKTKLMEMLQARKKAINALDKWARKFGGRIATSDGMFGFNCVLDSKRKDFEPKEVEHWKRTKHGQWLPRNSTKRGKEIAKEMRELSDKVTSVCKMGAFLGVPFMGKGLTIPSVGLYPRKNRLVIVVKCKPYNPPKRLNLTRISDLDFEKLTGEKL